MVEPTQEMGTTQVVERDTVDRLYRLDGVSHVAANINAKFAVYPHPGPDQEFLDWWKGLPHRFLSPPELLGEPRHGEVDPVVATRGSQIPPHRTQVPDVPDRRRPETRRRVGTRMSQRDEGGGGDGAERVRRAQFRPPGERRPRVRGRRRGQGGVGVAGAAEGHAEGDAGFVPLADDQVGGGLVSPHRLYPDFASPGTMERQLGGEVCYFDLAAIWAHDDGEGTSSQHVGGTPEFHVDLNEPASDYHDVWFSLGGTPPSAYPGVGPSYPLVQDPPVQERSEDKDEVPLVRRGRRVPRRRGCGTGGTCSPGVADLLAQTATLGTVRINFIHVGPNANRARTPFPCPPLVRVWNDGGTTIRGPKAFWNGWI
ncbi:hypothetical protein PIB30_014070 [Stylosanthes scabra]|uniref:Uncharacterized protein n=1 Tax=Stylosanthes scabra TaxID=79078 RepID=A0ABU6Q7E9_9FABA|nr:hypothetical protein [Stylosanthes scabra]